MALKKTTKMAVARTADNLLRAAHENPFRLFNLNELALLFGVGRHFITQICEAGAPFPGNVSRPEWILKWLHDHPDFERKKR